MPVTGTLPPGPHCTGVYMVDSPAGRLVIKAHQNLASGAVQQYAGATSAKRNPSLNIPNLATPAGAGHTAEIGSWVAYQYQEGQPLVDATANLTPSEGAQLLIELAKAVVALHGNGIFHHNITPHQIIVTPSGSPVLLDVGWFWNPAATRPSTAIPDIEGLVALASTLPLTSAVKEAAARVKPSATSYLAALEKAKGRDEIFVPEKKVAPSGGLPSIAPATPAPATHAVKAPAAPAPAVALEETPTSEPETTHQDTPALENPEETSSTSEKEHNPAAQPDGESLPESVPASDEVTETVDTEILPQSPPDLEADLEQESPQPSEHSEQLEPQVQDDVAEEGETSDAPSDVQGESGVSYSPLRSFEPVEQDALAPVEETEVRPQNEAPIVSQEDHSQPQNVEPPVTAEPASTPRPVLVEPVMQPVVETPAPVVESSDLTRTTKTDAQVNLPPRPEAKKPRGIKTFKGSNKVEGAPKVNRRGLLLGVAAVGLLGAGALGVRQLQSGAHGSNSGFTDKITTATDETKSGIEGYSTQGNYTLPISVDAKVFAAAAALAVQTGNTLDLYDSGNGKKIRTIEIPDGIQTIRESEIGDNPALIWKTGSKIVAFTSAMGEEGELITLDKSADTKLLDAGQRPMILDGNNVHEMTDKGEQEYLTITGLTPMAIDREGLISGSYDGPVTISSAEGKTLRTIELASPQEGLSLHQWVYAGNGLTATIWSQDILATDAKTEVQFALHRLSDGSVSAFVPMTLGDTADAQWNTGQGALAATYGPLVFNVARGELISELPDGWLPVRTKGSHVIAENADGKRLIFSGSNPGYAFNGSLLAQIPSGVIVQKGNAVICYPPSLS